MSVRAKCQTPSLAPASHVTLAGGLFLWVPGPCLLGDTVMCSPPRVVGRCYTPDRLSSQPGVHEKLKKCCEMSSPSPDVFLSIITMVIMMGKAGGIRRAPKKKKKNQKRGEKGKEERQGRRERMQEVLVREETSDKGKRLQKQGTWEGDLGLGVRQLFIVVLCGLGESIVPL